MLYLKQAMSCNMIVHAYVDLQTFFTQTKITMTKAYFYSSD